MLELCEVSVLSWCDASQCEVLVTSIWYHNDGIIVWDVCDIPMIMSRPHMLTGRCMPLHFCALHHSCHSLAQSWSAVKSCCRAYWFSGLLSSRYNFVSSANIWMNAWMPSVMSLMKHINSRGPRTLPCRISLNTNAAWDLTLLMTECWILVWRKSSIQVHSFPVTKALHLHE